MLFYCVFFFKQKTAYEMRISDWSSDVCSSDLLLTREAIGIYARALKPDGILLIHISNRFFGLEPVLAAEAKARGWTAAIRMDPGPAGDEYGDLTGSNWVALTATPDRMRQLTGGIRPRQDSYDDGEIGSE